MEELDKLRTGIIKFYNTTNGFGFVTEEESGKDFFIHASSRYDNDYIPQQQSVVVFTLRMSDRGPMADNVRPLEGS